MRKSNKNTFALFSTLLSVTAIAIVLHAQAPSVLSAYAGKTHTGTSGPQVKASTSVSAFIGDATFVIFGYTHPHARVTVEGQGIFAQSSANQHGYFELSSRFVAGSNREACITAFDNFGGSSQPVCLPPFPNKKRVVIGPIILPAIISLNKHEFAVQDYGIITGRTAPHSDVAFKFFSSDLGEDTTDGYVVPDIKTQADESGLFSITLPTDTQQALRLFTTTTVDEVTSGKSTTLTVSILPLWKLLIQRILTAIPGLGAHIIGFILLIECIVLGIFLWLFFTKNKKHPIILRPKYPLFKTDSL